MNITKVYVRNTLLLQYVCEATHILPDTILPRQVFTLKLVRRMSIIRNAQRLTSVILLFSVTGT